MQRPSDKKRRKITDTAARLFASRPFHKVRLDDVAAAAHVGKGTLYVYFRSKEDLYVTLLHDGFASLVDRLRDQLAASSSPENGLVQIVKELVSYAYDHPYVFELMRFLDPTKTERKLSRQRRELFAMIENVLRLGNEGGHWADPNPSLTAVFIPGFVRSAMLYGPRDLDEPALSAHILGLLRRGMMPRPRALAPANGRGS